MKTSERHRLKTNEFAETIAQIRDVWDTHRKTIAAAAIAAVVVVAGGGGFASWRQYQSSMGAAALAQAMAVVEAPIIPASPPAAPGSPQPPAPPAGSFATEEARAKAALAALLEVVARYGGTSAGITARYQAASLLVRLGRPAEAEREFQAVSAQDGRGLYGRMARLGLAEAQALGGRFDPAIATFREIVAQPGDLPVDGLLIKLGRTYAMAGKRTEALQTFNRVVDEHPQSVYAAEARREVEALKAGPGRSS
jgi:predicted negative regulator of RcsB-dependent stress response